MLERSPSTITPASDQRPRRHIVLTGQSIAKDHARCPRERAGLAAAWVAGILTIRPPTIPLASSVFGVCQELIREELRQLRETTEPASLLDPAWAAASPGERDAFVRGHLVELWDRIDRITR
jgi:hypothetical protein